MLLHDHLPAYITWEQYERNLARLAANRAHAETMGAVRHGTSLLAGLMGCGRCGHRMQVRYGGAKNVPGYLCHRGAIDYGEALCQYLPSAPVDAFVSQWVLNALEPAALTLSLEATARVEQERQALDQLWRQRVERAAYEAERAARHYRLVEPEHRLVARQLAQGLGRRHSRHSGNYKRSTSALCTRNPRGCRRRSVTPSRSWPEHPGPVACPDDDHARTERDRTADYSARAGGCRPPE